LLTVITYDNISVFDQINAALVSIRDFFQKQLLLYYYMIFTSAGVFYRFISLLGTNLPPKIWLSMHTDSHLHFALWLTLSISLFSIMKAGLYFI